MTKKEDLLKRLESIKIEEIRAMDKIKFKNFNYVDLYKFGVENLSFAPYMEDVDICSNVNFRLYWGNGDFLEIDVFSLYSVFSNFIENEEYFCFENNKFYFILDEITPEKILKGIEFFLQNNYSWLRKIITDPKFQAWGENK